MKKNNLIPENEEGIETNTESRVDLENKEKANTFFEMVKDRLRHVDVWHELAGKATADFALTDAAGNEISRPVQKGDHFRIDIPAPGSVTGEGYDWVRVEEIEERPDYLAIMVRPASNPNNKDQDIAHFFSDSATSSFIVKKKGLQITAGVYGRNEKPNTAVNRAVDKIRNTAIATGAVAGFSKIQWKSLVNGLVKLPEHS